MATRDQCYREIVDLFKESNIRKDVIEGIVDTIEGFRRQAKSPKEFNGKVNNYLKSVNRKAELEVRASAENAIKLDREIEYLKTFKKRGYAEGIKSMFRGTVGVAQGGNRSVAAHSSMLNSRAQGMFLTGLLEGDLRQVAFSGELDPQVSRIMFNRERKLADPTDVDPRAIEYADTLSKVYTFLQDNMEQVGGLRSRRDGYIKRTYDAAKIGEDKEKFISDMENWIDAEAMYGHQFDDPTYIRNDLREKAENILKDQDGRGVMEYDEGVFKLTMPDAYKGMGKQRSIVFKSPEAEAQFRETYSRGNLAEELLSAIRNDSMAVAAINRFGTNPKAAFEALKQQARDLIRKDNPNPADRAAAMSKFNSEIGPMDSLYSDIVNGFKVGDSFTAKANSAARSLASMATLGGASIPAFFTDGASNALNLSATSGKSVMGSYIEYLKGYANSLGSKHKKELLKRMDFNMTNLMGEFHSRFNPNDFELGGLSNMADVYYKFSLLQPHTETSKFTGHALQAQNLADNMSKSYSDMHPNMQATLMRFDISAKDWDIIRTANPEMINDIAHLTPQVIEGMQLPPREKRRLADSIGMLIHDNAEYRGTPTPDAGSRSYMLYGSDPNTLGGQVIRHMGHLKSFPLAIAKANMYNIMNHPEAVNMTFSEVMRTPRGMQSIAKMVVALSLTGAMSIAVRDMLNNREPDISSGQFWSRAFIMGGSAGIYGDFLLAEYDKGYRSFSSDVLGPVLGSTFESGAELWAGLVRGDADARKAFDLLVRNTPGNNLFYTKAALDHFILDEIRTVIDPEYMARRRQRMQQQGREPLIDLDELVGR